MQEVCSLLFLLYRQKSLTGRKCPKGEGKERRRSE